MADKKREREERLAAALRENLRKRKAQARELGAKAENPLHHPSDGAPPRSGED